MLMAVRSAVHPRLALVFSPDSGPPRAELKRALDAVKALNKRISRGEKAKKELPEFRATAARLAFACGMTVTELAVEMGVRPGTASKLLHGARVEQECEPILSASAHRLTLYHFVELHRLGTQAERERFLRQAIQEGLSQRVLHQLVSKRLKRFDPIKEGVVSRERPTAMRIIRVEFPGDGPEVTRRVARVSLRLRKVSAETLESIAAGG